MAKGDIRNRKEVLRLHKDHPAELSARHMDEALKANGHAFIGAKKGWCDVCGEEFDSQALWKSKRKKNCKCPHCGTKLAVKRSPTKIISDERYYFSTVEVIEGWQVCVTYLCKRYSQRRLNFATGATLQEQKVSFQPHMVYQWWIKPGATPLLLSFATAGMAYYCDQWNLFSDFRFRREGSEHTITGWIGSRQKLLPVLKRNGLKKLSEFVGLKPQILAVLNNTKAEILLKHGAQGLYEALIHYPSQVERYWDTIRVALRHGYIPRYTNIWLDHLFLLEQHGRDLKNPKFICPPDLMKAHQLELKVEERRRERLRREREKREQERIIRQLEKDERLNVEYVKRMGRMLGVMVKVKDIELKPLQSVREFYEEGNEMHHCVFSNKYYEKEHCLILSAKVKGKRTETVEVDMRSWKIIQCRGPHNKHTPHHDKIMQAVEDNMGVFRRHA